LPPPPPPRSFALLKPPYLSLVYSELRVQSKSWERREEKRKEKRGKKRNETLSRKKRVAEERESRKMGMTFSEESHNLFVIYSCYTTNTCLLLLYCINVLV
jgi:hypothetical protein